MKFTKISATLFGLAVIALNLIPVPALAAGASISLVANKATVPAGSSLIVAVYMNGGGTNVNAVQADLSYPAGKLQYVGFSASGSAFEIAASNGGGDGAASIARGTVSGVSGSGLIGTVTFKALAASGSASISVAGSSALVSDGNAVAFAPGGVNVNFGVVAASPSSPAAPAAPAAPAPPKDTTPPVISALQPKDVTPFSTTISWATDEPADSIVEYGLDTSYGLSASLSPAVTAHVVSLNSAFLTPLSTLHYRVKSTDGSGNAQVGSDQTLVLPGVPVSVVVRGHDGKPRSGVDVTLDNQTKATNQSGAVTFATGLGNKQIVTSVDGSTVKKSITVTKTDKVLPPYQLALAKQPQDRWMMTSFGLAVLVLLLLLLDAALFGSKYVTSFIRHHSWLRLKAHPAGMAPPLVPIASLPNRQPPYTAPANNTETAPERDGEALDVDLDLAPVSTIAEIKPPAADTVVPPKLTSVPALKHRSRVAERPIHKFKTH